MEDLPDLGAGLDLTGRNVVHQLSQHMQVNLAMFRKAIVNEVVSVKRLELRGILLLLLLLFSFGS